MQRLELLDELAKAFTFNGYTDNTTIIHRDECKQALAMVRKLANEITKRYPKDFCRRIKRGIKNEKHCLSVLRECLRYHGKRVVSIRRLVYNKALKKQICKYDYYIL